MFSCKRTQNLEFLTIQQITCLQMGVDLQGFKRKEFFYNHFKLLFLIGCTVYLEIGLINIVVYSGIANLAHISGSLSIFNQGCLILFKFTMFLNKWDKFCALIWDINQLAKKANGQENKKWLQQNVQARQVTKIYYYVCWVALMCSCIFPLVLMAYDYNKNKVFNQKLPFGGKFPYENRGGVLIFILNYILSSIYIYVLLNMLISVDTLYGWFIHSISGHFHILRCKVVRAALSLQNGDCENFKQQIGLIINYHNQTLKFVKDLNALFGEILWAEVTLSCLQMCFVIYTLKHDQNMFNMPFNFMALVVVIIQMIIYCFGGEKIKNECIMLSMDFYLQFPWHSMCAEEKKLMLLPLMRSQRLSILRGFFFEVDRNLLVYIVKTAFSFNALLSAMEE